MAEERMTDDPFKPHENKTPEEELGFELAADEEQVEKGEIDEDLVGLTPSDLERQLNLRREQEERIRREVESLLRQGDGLMDGGKFREAERAYKKAAMLDDSDEVRVHIWAARTEKFTSTAVFSDKTAAREFAEETEGVREHVLERLGGSMREERDALDRDMAPLREKVEAARDARRGAFRDNRNYWLVRLLIAAAFLAAFGIACAVTASFIVRTRDMTAPILTGVFGGLTFLALIVTVVLLRKFYAAQRLVSDNERLSSTEDGAALKTMLTRRALLDLALEGRREEFESEDLSEEDEDLPEEETENPEEDHLPEA